MARFELSRDTKSARRYERGRLALFLLGDVDTPAMVELVTDDGSVFATYECAWGESSVDGYELTGPQVDWLEGRRNAVERHYSKIQGENK